MKNLKVILSLGFISFMFMLDGCGGGSGSGGAPIPIPVGSSSVITAFSINGNAGVIVGNKIAMIQQYGTNVTSLTAIFTAPGAIVTANGVRQISGVTTNNFTQPVVYTVTPITQIGANKSASAKASASNDTSYTVTVTVASISAKAITTFSLKSPNSASVTSGIVSPTDISLVMPSGTDLTALVATFTSSGESVAINGVVQVRDVTQNNFTNPVIYTVHAADGTTQNYTVTVTVASESANDMLAFSLDGSPGVISQGGTTQTIVVQVPNGTNVNGLVAAFITTGAKVNIATVEQISSTTQNNFTNAVTYTVTAANGLIRTYIVTVLVSSVDSKLINIFSFGNISGIITGQDIAVTVPFGTNVVALIASFTTTGVNVTVGGLTQTSTLTSNNFTNPVSYVVTAADGSTAIYTVTVTVALSLANAITAFSIGSSVGNINGLNIAVTMPFGTNVTNVIATFTTTGVNVKISGVIQSSGLTANSFAAPVSYVVTAANGTLVTYTVTVSGGPTNFILVGLFGMVNNLTSLGVYTNVSIPNVNLDGVSVNSNGRFVAVGVFGVIVTSSNGITWNTSASASNSLAGNLAGITVNSSDLFVAVGLNGGITTSPDGITWTTRTSGTTNALNGVSVNSAGLFVAVGATGTIITSPDGITWTTRTSGTTNALNGVSVNSAGLFVAVGATGTIITSPDGINWTTRASNTTNTLLDVTVNSTGKFVAVGTAGTIVTSLDGITWVPVTSGITNTLRGVSFGGGRFVAVGDLGNLTSPDGTTWTVIPPSATTSNFLRGASISPNNGLLVVVGTLGTIIISSDHGTTWTQQTSGTANTLSGVTNSTGIFVAVGDSGTIVTSPDGINWTMRTSGTAQILRGIVFGGGQFVVVGNLGTVLTSPDGINWTTRTSSVTNILRGVSVNESGIFVAVGDSGTIVTSPDGINWAQQTSGTANILRGVGVNSANLFIAVGSGGTILTSPDGINWTTRTSGVTNSLFNVSVNSAGLIVAFGGSILNSSDGGITWTLVTPIINSLEVQGGVAY